MITEIDVVGRLLLALLLGGLIGLERELLGRPAGLRTHILVSVGSALIFIVSVWGFEGLPYTADRARIAAQVVSGVGFLGAGTIMREGVSVRGLTTAASLWVVAGIGLAVGSGLYFVATFGTLIVFFALLVLNKVEHRVFSSRKTVVSVRVQDKPGKLASISTVLAARGIDITSVDIFPEDEQTCTIELHISSAIAIDQIRLLDDLRQVTGVENVAFK